MFRKHLRKFRADPVNSVLGFLISLGFALEAIFELYWAWILGIVSYFLMVVLSLRELLGPSAKNRSGRIVGISIYLGVTVCAIGFSLKRLADYTEAYSFDVSSLWFLGIFMLCMLLGLLVDFIVEKYRKKKGTFMTNRLDWKPALSVGPGALKRETLNVIADAGIEEIELASGNYAPFFDEIDFPKESISIAEQVKECGLALTSIHLPFAPFDKLDPAYESNREFIIKIQGELIRAAGHAGIKIAVIHPSGEPYEEGERAERIKCAIETIAELVKIAKECDVTLALENLPRTCLGRVHEESLQFLNAIPELRACFDMNHSLRENNVDYIRALGNKIITLHVSDYDFVDERHLLPGDGSNDWQTIISTLEEIGYEGRFLYEVRGDYTYEQIGENYKSLIKNKGC